MIIRLEEKMDFIQASQIMKSIRARGRHDNPVELGYMLSCEYGAQILVSSVVREMAAGNKSVMLVGKHGEVAFGNINGEAQHERLCSCYMQDRDGKNPEYCDSKSMEELSSKKGFFWLICI